MEELLIDLARVVDSSTDGPTREKAEGLLGWYGVHGYLTARQLRFAKSIVKVKTKKKQRKTNNYWLYAIGYENLVKIGFSYDVPRRLRDLQTGCPGNLKILWRLDLQETNRNRALKFERKIHRQCRNYRLRGEWFDSGCLETVKNFAKIDNN